MFVPVWGVWQRGPPVRPVSFSVSGRARRARQLCVLTGCSTVIELDLALLMSGAPLHTLAKKKKKKKRREDELQGVRGEALRRNQEENLSVGMGFDTDTDAH